MDFLLTIIIYGKISSTLCIANTYNLFSQYSGLPIDRNTLEDCANITGDTSHFKVTNNYNSPIVYLCNILKDELTIRRAQYGALPRVLVAAFSALVFFLIATMSIIDKISRLRLNIYSGMTWITLLVGLYILFALLIHHEASDYTDFAMLVLFFTYTMLPFTLRVSTLLGALFSCAHIVITSATATSDSTQRPEIIVREVSTYGFKRERDRDRD